MCDLGQKPSRGLHLLIKNHRGVMLIQMIVAAAIGGVITLALTTMILDQKKQIKLIEQKAEILDIKNQISTILSEPNICECNLNPSKLSPSGGAAALEFSTFPRRIPLVEGLRHDCNKATQALVKAGDKTNTHLQIDSIDMEVLDRIGTSRNWMGNIKVKFSGSSISLKDLSVPISFRTLTDVAPYKVDNCYVSGRLRIESGSAVIPDGCYDGAGNRNGFASGYFCTSGSPGKKIAFDRPFTSPPTVIVTLAGASADGSLAPCTGGAMDQVGTTFSNVTTDGFVGHAWMSPFGSTCPPYSDNSGAIKFSWYAIGL